MYNRLKERKQLELHSDNNFYEAYHVNIGDIREIWYVRAKISPFLPSPQNLQKNMEEELRQLQNLVSQQGELIQNFEPDHPGFGG